ncbi:cation acetate symporter [Dactylosporangium matsuzakiense]|uniref:Cation acetate symporter n=1 Tax=Dactylosporangium matsuzakiense TaxID=53360 RepID=A0A9W6NN63_9ACTN|nr:cation acetate symporter [Dactylosporangium matsuzakiense]UWZ44897.1 cation acetate symporter [Dactylosporangium matsuzakiense]GLL03625.1 cation acetate symporter [Dactylosporangium matsuzakiense]
MPETILAATSVTTQRTLTLTLFIVLVGVTLGITIWASRQNRTAADFYAGGRSFSGFQNGLAIGGDYMSAASFLGIAGIIALNGYDGFLYSIGFLVAWLVALLLVAELMRNSGRYTMADVLAFRMRQAPVRTAGSISTIIVSIFYLLAQMVGAGALVALLLGIKAGDTFLGMSAETAKIVTIALIGVLMIVYVTVGGMKGTTYVQIVKAFMLMIGALILTLLVLAHYKFNLSSLLGEAAAKSGKADAFLEPGLRYGREFAGNAVATAWSKLDLISLGLALVLGTAGLPHILIRFYTVPNAKAARKSVVWAIGLIGAFYLMTLALGFGAAALVGRQAIVAQDAAGNTAAPQLAQVLGKDYLGGDFGGSLLLAIIAAVAFATILAVVAGLTLASSSSLAHDLYANVLRRGQTDERQEVQVARWSALAIGAVSIVLGIIARNLNVAFLVALAFAIAASANLPAILFSLFWKRFNTRGATWGIYAGLIAAVGIVLMSPIAWGGVSSARTPATLNAAQAKTCGVPVDSKQVSNATALFSCTTAAPIPLENPGLISIPIGFIFAAIGAMTSKERDSDKYAELEARSLTGAGAH